MNRYFIGLLLVLILAGTGFAQGRGEKMQKKMERQRERVEELEKIKLIEVLDMNEETSVKFFTRRKDFSERQKELGRSRDEKMNQLQKFLDEDRADNDAGYKKLVDEITGIDRDLVRNRSEFFGSLKDILTSKQIAKMVVFERNFRRELRDLILKERKRNSH